MIKYFNAVVICLYIIIANNLWCGQQNGSDTDTLILIHRRYEPEFKRQVPLAAGIKLRYKTNDELIILINSLGLKNLTVSYQILDNDCSEVKYYIVFNTSSEIEKIISGFGKVLYTTRHYFLFRPDREDIKYFYDNKINYCPMPDELEWEYYKPQIKSATELKLSITDKDNTVISNLLNSVEPVEVQQLAQELQDFGTRYSFANSQTEAVRNYIVNKMQSYGYNVEVQSFKNEGVTNYNIIASTTGQTIPDKCYVICAHYDSISNQPYTNAPGADDNASGTAAVLTIAKMFATQKFNYSIKFLCFGGEEQGMEGSRYYVTTISTGPTILAAINMDMIGYWQSGKRYDLDITANMKSEWLAQRMQKASTQYIQHPAKITVDDGAYWSDHSSFWAKKIFAIMGSEAYDWYSEDFNPHYHTVNDTVNNLDFGFYIKNLKVCMATLAELANPYDTPANVAVLNPDGVNDNVEKGKEYKITWTGAGDSFVDIYYSNYPNDNEKYFIARANGIDNEYSWGTTGIPQGNKYIYLYYVNSGYGEWSPGPVTILSSDLDKVYVYPNPINLTSGDPQAVFVGLSPVTKIKIFDISGTVVYEKKVEN